MGDHQLALDYLPRFLFDEAETIPMRAIGYTVFRTGARSLSFPKREIHVGQGCAFVIEYACYWDYDIQHMYDLEHVWVYVDTQGRVMDAEGSFHGKYLKLMPPIHGVQPLQGLQVTAYCQPGKHAFLAFGEQARLLPDWYEACTDESGGPVLIGNCFSDEYQPTEQDDRLSARYLKEHLSFTPTLRYTRTLQDWQAQPQLMPWEELHRLVPGWIRAECDRLNELYRREENHP